MAKLYITSPISNDTLYRPVTLETNTTSTLADNIDNHHGNQVIITDNSDEVILTESTAKVDGYGVDRDNSIEYVKTVSNVAVSSSVCEQTKDKLQITDKEVVNLSDKSESENNRSDQLSSQDKPNEALPEKSDVPKVTLSEKSTEDVRISAGSLPTPDSSSQSDAITAAAERVNEVLLSESNTANTSLTAQQLKPGVGVRESEIVVIPDESPTNHEPQSSSHNLTSQPSFIPPSSQIPTFQPQSSADIPSIQKTEQTAKSLADVKPLSVPVISNSATAATVSPMTSMQQSFIQKLIPSLINLNNPGSSSAPAAPEQPANSLSKPPPIPKLIPAATTARTTSTTPHASGATPHAGSAKSNGVITIDDDDDLVVTQVRFYLSFKSILLSCTFLIPCCSDDTARFVNQ